MDYSRIYFERYYSDRDWRFYRGIASLAIQDSEPGPILDVGAGVGFLVEAFMRWGIECTGIEGSEAAVEIGLQRCPGLSLRPHSIGEAFPFANESFQVVYINQVIEHLNHSIAGRCLKEAWRVLRPKGMLFVASPSKFNRDEQAQDPTHVRLYSPSELRSLLRLCGFDRIQARNTPRQLLGSSRAGRFLMGMIFRGLQWDRLSNTATCTAFKSDPSQYGLEFNNSENQASEPKELAR